ncbi:hypothetical protein [Lyngbya sp. CCY1209]|nr:hypothetical protein [Lyngbya sp. CCY1209]
MSNLPKEYTVNLEETGELMIPEPVRQLKLFYIWFDGFLFD